jgi:hypothetical protein
MAKDWVSIQWFVANGDKLTPVPYKSLFILGKDEKSVRFALDDHNFEGKPGGN